MKRKIAICVALLLFWGVVGAYAQQTEMARLQNALDKTEEVIARAGEAVSESGSERARNQLEMAIRLQTMAKQITDEIVFGNDMALRGAQAGKYTLAAREKAQLAIAITRQAAENEDYVRSRIEKTDELINRIEERIGEQPSPRLQTLVDSSRERQLRAMELFRNRRLKAALQMTIQVEKSLQKAGEEAGGLNRAQQRFQTQMDRFLNLWENLAGSGLSEQPEIRKRLENADQFRTQADGFAAKHQYGQAEKAVNRGIEILSRIAEEIREPEKIRAAIRDTEQYAQRLNERISLSGTEKQRQQFRTAAEHLEKARHLYEQGSYEDAAAQLQAARQLFNRLGQQLEETSRIGNANGGPGLG